MQSLSRVPVRPGSAASRRFGLALVLALAAGLAIAWVDSRPTWDETGMTVMALVGAAFLATVVAGRRPWIWALLVGIWTPLIEIPTNHQTAAIAALVFAGVGAALGWVVSRVAAEG